MGSFAEYVNKDIDGEINEANANQQARDEQTGRFVPDRFKGKTTDDVIQSFEELEKLNSRQANDLGQMRSQVDELMELTRSASPAVEPAKPLTVDDLYENPDEAIRRVASEAISEEVTELRNTVQEMRQTQIVDAFEAKYPNWLEVSQSPEFSQWVGESPYRVNMVEAVRARGDHAAAQEILGMYYDTHASDAANEQAEQAVVTRNQLRDATLESSSPAQAEVSDTYSRQDLLEARLAAKRGDGKAQRWLSSNAETIAAAYAEGRIVD